MNKGIAILTPALPLILVVSFLVLAKANPSYFTNAQFLATTLFLQVLIVSLWFYDRMFFPMLMIVFFWAGMDVPWSNSWMAGRWLVLGCGAFVGFVRGMRLGRHTYNRFHAVAFLCVASALVSALISQLPTFSALKALSLFILFLYGSSGARLVLRDPQRFFRGLLLVCEINVYATAFFYLVLGQEIWGNINSMGAVEGVVAFPLLLWGAIAAAERNLRVRRGVACLGAMYLVYFSVTRAALGAAMIAAILLFFGLRRHKLLIQGLVGALCLVAITALGVPKHFEDLKTSFTEGVIYKGHRAEGLLASRRTPWQETIEVIREHPYFGSGFGASVSQDTPFGEVGNYSSSSLTNREHGSSYLAIMEWMGLLGILPFVALILLLVFSLCRVLVWLRKTGDVAHYSVPVMMVLTAGLVHALFEDWMFAVGYYLTVLFWSLAFLLMDMLPPLLEQKTVFMHGMRFRFAFPSAPSHLAGNGSIFPRIGSPRQ